MPHAGTSPGTILPAASGQNSPINSTVRGSIRIGSNSTRSGYTVPGNLTIEDNSSLTLVNTYLSFSFNSGNRSRLLDLGNLTMYGSTITMSPGTSGDNSLNFTERASRNSAGLVMHGSSVLINGTFSAYGSNLSLSNSSLSSLGNRNSHLAISMRNSSALFYRSTVGGARRTDRNPEYSAGLAYGRNMPYAYIGYMNFASGWMDGNALINMVRLNITYGAYTHGEEASLIVNVTGAPSYRFVFPDTGSVLNITSATVSIRIPGTLPSASSLLNDSGLSVYYTANQSSTSVEVYNLTAGFLSNDTVARVGGRKAFGLYLSGSDVYMIQSGLDFNYRKDYYCRNLPNPEKNAIFLFNGSVLYEAGMWTLEKATTNISSPIIAANSSAFLYGLQEFRDIAPEGMVNGTVNSVTPASINVSRNIYTESLNRHLETFLSGRGIVYSRISRDGYATLPLLRLSDLSGREQFYGNYEVSVYNTTSTFSESPDRTGMINSTPIAVHIPLPELKGSVSAGTAVINSSLELEISVTSEYAGISGLNLDVEIKNSSRGISIKNFRDNITGNSTFSRNVSSRLPGKIWSGFYSLILRFKTGSPVYNVNHTLCVHRIEVFSNVNLSMVTSYSWKIPWHSTSLNVTVHNGGEQAADVNIRAEFMQGGTDIGEMHNTVAMAPDASGGVTFNFSSGRRINAVNITLSTGVSVQPEPGSVSYRLIHLHSQNGTTTTAYTLTIGERGKPAGTEWSVTVSGSVLKSSGKSMQTTLSAGSYVIRPGGMRGYHPARSEIPVNVTSNETVVIHYIVNRYGITFRMFGLPSSAGWSLSIAGHIYVMRANSIGLRLSNGTYEFSTTVPHGYASSHHSGNITVSGSNATISIQARKTESPGPLSAFLVGMEKAAPLVSPVVAAIIILSYEWRKHRIIVCNRCGRTLMKGERRCSCRKDGVKNK